MLKSLVSGIKLYLDKRLKEQRDETDERIADAKWHETTATQLFSETVIADDAGGVGYASLAYDEFINADTIIVTFDGVKYTCDIQSSALGSTYGAISSESGYDFSEYPFSLSSENREVGVLNTLCTQTPGTHTVSISTESTAYTDRFVKGVNKIAGWKEEVAKQLFSEAVTTETGQFGNEAELAYSSPIDADTLIVTFNGTKYVCPRINLNGIIAYGGIGAKGPDFSEYPFAVARIEDKNMVFVENSGTYTVSASVENTTYTDAFKIGVNANIFKEVENISEADAVLVYFPNRVFVNVPIVEVEGDTTTANVSIIPNGYEKRFSGTFLFLKSDPSSFTCGTLTLYEDDGINILICEPNQVVENSGTYTFSFLGNAFLNLSEVSNVVIRYYKIGVPFIGGDSGDIG